MTVVLDFPAAPAAVDTPSERAVTAYLACVARHGVGKTTADDVARAMGSSRATLYRHVGAMPALAQLVLQAETERVMTAVEDAVVRAPDLESALTAFLWTAHCELRDHAALQFMRTHEPELLQPALTFDRGAGLLHSCAARFASAFVLHGADRENALRIGEWLTRLVMLGTFEPESPYLDDQPTVERFVSTYLAPAFATPSRKGDQP
jgi:AcrR family transcriptional regulator